MKNKLKILIPLLVVIGMIVIGDTLAYGKDQSFIDINHNVVSQNGYVSKSKDVNETQNLTVKEAYTKIKEKFGNRMEYSSDGKMHYDGKAPYYIITCKDLTKDGLNTYKYKVFKNKIERY